MQIKELKAEGLSHTYAITVPKEDLATKLEAKIKEMQPQVSLKGFRPGKVPVSHIRKMFGQSIMKDVVEETVNETTQQAINDNKIRPAGQPQVDLRANGEDVTKGEADLEYQLTVESIPDFEPVDPEKLRQSLKKKLLSLAKVKSHIKRKLRLPKPKKVMRFLLILSEQSTAKLLMAARWKAISLSSGPVHSFRDLKISSLA